MTAPLIAVESIMALSNSAARPYPPERKCPRMSSNLLKKIARLSATVSQ
ncbi:MAG TPA: hypothetical protein VNS79_12555 [Sphingobium sp.]|nr:hypothetical protein [Sphingobium sp.]